MLLGQMTRPTHIFFKTPKPVHPSGCAQTTTFGDPMEVVGVRFLCLSLRGPMEVLFFRFPVVCWLSFCSSRPNAV